jgi:hypothetical protein
VGLLLLAAAVLLVGLFVGLRVKDEFGTSSDGGIPVMEGGAVPGR